MKLKIRVSQNKIKHNYRINTTSANKAQSLFHDEICKNRNYRQKEVKLETNFDFTVTPVKAGGNENDFW